MYDLWGHPAGSELAIQRRNLAYGAVPAAGKQYTQHDDLLAALRESSLADAGARVVGSRRAGMNAGGGDPALAAFGGLAGLIGGQSDASRGVLDANTKYMTMKDMQDFERAMLKMKMDYEEKLARMQASAQMWSGLGGLTGTLGGAAIGKWG